MERKDYQFIRGWAKYIKAVEYLGGKCVKCGEDDIVLLDFHHLYSKQADLGSYIRAKAWEDIVIEMDKCELLCCRCHRLEHFDKERFEKYKEEIQQSSKNVKTTRSKIKGLEDKTKEVIGHLKEGKAYREIEKLVEVSRKYIQKVARENSYDRRCFTNKIPIDLDELTFRYNRGDKINDILEHFKCSKYPLYQAIKILKNQGKVYNRK